MAAEVLLSELIEYISPLVANLLKKGIGTVIEASAQGENIGMCEIHGSKNTSSEVHLKRYGGIPQNKNEFSVSSIQAGGFVWKLYFKNSGTWYRRFGGNTGARVFEGDLFIHGPLCPDNSIHNKFKLSRKYFWRRWICEYCNKEISYKNPNKVNKLIAKQLRKKILSEFELK